MYVCGHVCVCMQKYLCMCTIIIADELVYHITWSYGQSHINTGSHLMAMVKLTVTKLNVQYSVLHIISCYQNLPLVYITAYNQHVKCLLHLVASVKYHWKEIITWTTTWGNTVIIIYTCTYIYLHVCRLLSSWVGL